jgi:uncharacterized membrane protein YcaP (DUF421 family)
MEHFFFNGWMPLLRTLTIGILAYFSLIIILRTTGKRTLSKMNAFDFIVTVALGSTLATILISQDVSLAQGALALALLVGLQFAITWSSVRLRWVRRFVTGEPSLIVYQGEYLADALRRVRVTKDEVRAAVRAAGLATLDDVEAVVLETDGSFSVVKRDDRSNSSSLIGLKTPAQTGEKNN